MNTFGGNLSQLKTNFPITDIVENWLAQNEEKAKFRFAPGQKVNIVVLFLLYICFFVIFKLGYADLHDVLLSTVISTLGVTLINIHLGKLTSVRFNYLLERVPDSLLCLVEKSPEVPTLLKDDIKKHKAKKDQ